MEYAEDNESVKAKLKKFWKWLWQSDSIWSYIVFLIIVFVFIKFIFLPGLSLAFGMGLSGLPLAIVESSSMDHHILQDSTGLTICGKNFQDTKFLDSEEYWSTCGSWYEQNMNITKEQFSSFSFKNGFRKGDIMVIVKKKAVNIGDILVFEAGSAHPIIHRVISLNPLQTKGDHNGAQLVPGNNPYNADERAVPENKIIGTAVFKIPWLGWPKLFIVELWNKIF